MHDVPSSSSVGVVGAIVTVGLVRSAGGAAARVGVFSARMPGDGRRDRRPDGVCTGRLQHGTPAHHVGSLIRRICGLGTRWIPQKLFPKECGLHCPCMRWTQTLGADDKANSRVDGSRASVLCVCDSALHRNLRSSGEAGPRLQQLRVLALLAEGASVTHLVRSAHTACG